MRTIQRWGMAVAPSRTAPNVGTPQSVQRSQSNFGEWSDFGGWDLHLHQNVRNLHRWHFEGVCFCWDISINSVRFFLVFLLLVPIIGVKFVPLGELLNESIFRRLNFDSCLEARRNLFATCHIPMLWDIAPSSLMFSHIYIHNYIYTQLYI